MHGLARLLGFLGCLGAILLGSSSDAQPRRNPRHDRAVASRRPALPSSASTGWANLGALEHGRALTEGEGIRFLPGRTLHHGTEELVGLLERVGGEMRRRFGARLTVGDLSARQGGPVLRHRSHQSGRDVDVCFFVRRYSARGQGAPVELDDYVSFDRNGRSLDGRYVFDTARNWALIEAIVSDRRARIEWVFVSAPLRQLLLAHGRARGADGGTLDRAARMLLQPRGVSPHDNHFHVRIDCPAGDSQCREGVHRPRVLRRRAALRHGPARREAPVAPTGRPRR